MLLDRETSDPWFIGAKDAKSRYLIKVYIAAHAVEP